MPDQGYDVVFPCEGDLFCLHMWSSARDFIAVATNGRIQTRSETRSGCSLPITNQADGVVLPRFCQRGTGVPFPQQGEDAVKTPGNPPLIPDALHTHVAACDPS